MLGTIGLICPKVSKRGVLMHTVVLHLISMYTQEDMCLKL